jgi:hypothetical protein
MLGVALMLSYSSIIVCVGSVPFMDFFMMALG